MRWLAAICISAAACGFQHGVVADDGGVVGDGMADATNDAPPDAFDPSCFGKAPFTVCLQSLPSTPVSLPMSIDTDSAGGSNNCLALGGQIAMVSGAEACVIAGTDVTAAGSIVGSSGARPLVIVATGTITVTTTNFDITSNSSTGDGPNANAADCAPAPTMNGGSTNSGDGAGGGGAGGTFGTQGGNGGTAIGGTIAGGIAQPAPTSFDKLRGGCRGGSGDGPGGVAMGGSGGGALYLVAREAINITGTINASGAGGRGGQSGPGGGGGGGSGGMVVLHAPTLSIGVAGRVFANGGGGGGGTGEDGIDGIAGGDGATPDTPALGGGAGSIAGTIGGAGAYKATAAGSALGALEGGGGGGGGAGVIRILSGQSVAPINVSPTPILN